MLKALDLMDVAFANIAKDEDLWLDEDFMMAIFDLLVDKIPQFGECLIFMFDKKKSSPVGSRCVNDKAFLFSLSKTKLRFPTQNDIVQSHSCTILISTIAAF